MLQGDGAITVRVDSMEDLPTVSKAGIMIRDALAPTSPHVSVFVRPMGVVEFQWRRAERGEAQTREVHIQDFEFPHWIRLTRKGNSFVGKHSHDGVHWQEVLTREPNESGPVEIAMSETAQIGLAVASWRAKCRAEACFSNVAVAGSISPGGPFTTSLDIAPPIGASQTNDGTATVRQDAVEPRRWFAEAELTQDEVEILSLRHGVSAGSMVYDDVNDTYTILGVGKDIWFASDQFHFAHSELKGDGSIAARIDSIEHRHDWSKAGVMIRGTTRSDSAYAAVFLTPEHRVCFQYRSRAGQNAITIHANRNAVTLPHWVKLVRKDDTFKAQHSADGQDWKDLEGGSTVTRITHTRPAAAEIEMGDLVRIGLAATSHAGALPAEAKISHVTLTGNVEPSGEFLWSEDIGFKMIMLPDK
jgi:hypothetical protein